MDDLSKQCRTDWDGVGTGEFAQRSRIEGPDRQRIERKVNIGDAVKQDQLRGS